MEEIARISGKAICETAEDENLLMLHAWRILPERGGRQSAQYRKQMNIIKMCWSFFWH